MWTQGAYARDAAGNPVAPGSHKATRWCAVGALLKGLDGTSATAKVFFEAIHLFEVRYDTNINVFNDREFLYKEDVIRHFRWVAEYLQRRGK